MKRHSALLANQAGITDLLNMLDQGQSMHHVLPCQSREPVEVLMTVRGMPAPSIFRGVR
jgi:hypothetical protein